MPLSLLEQFWRRLYGSDRFGECLRVFLALAGIVVYGLVSGWLAPVIPMLLGAIACALAETEDQWRNRLLTLLVTLGCFAVAAFAVEWLLPHRLLFATDLWLSTFLLVMLGALNGRYATIAGATLILAVYTMIGADLASGPPADLLWEPLLILAGAAWYGVLSLLWSALLPQQAVRHALARLFHALADQLEGKAALFVPVRGLDHQALQLALAMRNEAVVRALNDTRLVLIDRIGSRRPRGTTAALLQRYFMAQDIHERVNSSHYPYDALTSAFFHSDVLFRCERLLHLQAARCRRQAEALRAQSTQGNDAADAAALDDFQTAIATLRQSPQPPSPDLLRALDALSNNLRAIDAQLAGKALLDPQLLHAGGILQDPAPQSLREAWARLRAQLSPRSLRFRHALRLATALLAGDIVLQLAHPQHGYWILLTTLFVCQPSYHATWRVLLQRVGGTVIGLVAGWMALRSLPLAGQMPLVVLTGVGFFATRHRRYALATAAITLFVVLLVNQVGNGYAVIWPRLLDTLIGAAIAALAIQLILPDWQHRQLGQVLADTVRSDAHYLTRIIPQYRSGKHDDLDYRIARRDAHNAHAELSGVLANMLREPGATRREHEALLRFLTAAQVLLGHLSTLGAHRQQLASASASDTVQRFGDGVAAALENVAAALSTPATIPLPETTRLLPDTADRSDSSDDTAQLVLAQLALIAAQGQKLATLAVDIRRD